MRIEMKCEGCGKSVLRYPSDRKRRQSTYCSTDCAQKSNIKIVSNPEHAKTPFDKRLLELKEDQNTYEQISNILLAEKYKSPSGKRISKTLVQSRFNYLIGRKYGPVKVWRGTVRHLKFPRMLEMKVNQELILKVEMLENQIREIYEFIHRKDACRK